MKSLEGTQRKSPAHSPEAGAPGASPSSPHPHHPTDSLTHFSAPTQMFSSPGNSRHFPTFCHTLTLKIPESSIAGDTPVLSWMSHRHPNASPSPPNLLLPTSASHLREIPNLEGLISPATVTALRSPLHLPTPLLLLLHPTSQGSDTASQTLMTFPFMVPMF